MEQQIDRDSRPFYSRPKGCMGIYIDFLDVVPENKDEYGSPQYMRMDFLDKLYQYMSGLPTLTVKSALERKAVMDGVIMEGWQKGVILTVSFDTQSVLTTAWNEYESNRVAPTIVQCLNTPALLRAIGAKSIQLRARMWKDEFMACQLEMEDFRIKAFSFKDKEGDIQMLRKVRDFQRKELLELVQDLKDHYTAMDKAFPNLTVTVKNNKPLKLLKITNYKHFLAQVKEIQSTKKIQMKPFEVYQDMRDRLWKGIDTVEENICHPLAQIHGACESQNQKDLKHKMKTECADSKARLQDDFDWTHLKHPEWQQKILNREHDLFLGLASVVGAGMDTLLEIDIQCDEYMSGVDGVKI